MRAWINLTSGHYHGVVVAAWTGTQVTPHSSVAVQLAAQEAKAWARIGDRWQTEVALDRGQRLLDSMPYPENLDHHFVVDPTLGGTNDARSSPIPVSRASHMTLNLSVSGPPSGSRKRQQPD